jgi:hypothetical protein
MSAKVDAKCLLHVHGFAPEMAQVPVEVYESFSKFGQVCVLPNVDSHHENIHLDIDIEFIFIFSRI